MKIYEVQERTPQLLKCLLNIWEDSVRATHHFLSDAEVKQIKEYVPQALSGVEHLIVAENESDKAIAFMGTENSRLEMLFLSPTERGIGLLVMPMIGIIMVCFDCTFGIYIVLRNYKRILALYS